MMIPKQSVWSNYLARKPQYDL